MKVLIQPFEQLDSLPIWEGLGRPYVWGKAAERLGLHYDRFEDSEAWETTLEMLEQEVVAYAEKILGKNFVVGIAPMSECTWATQAEAEELVDRYARQGLRRIGAYCTACKRWHVVRRSR